MPTDTLSDARCKGAKPKASAYKLFDGGGLHLFCSPTGAKVWRLAYRLAGKPKTISFGPYPAVTLADARKRRDEAKTTLRNGGDPMAPRKETAMPTLGEVWDTYWAGRKDVTERYVTNARRCMEMHLWPHIGERPLATLAKADLMAPLNKLDQLGKHEYVRKARGWLSQVFEYAIEQELCTANPAAAIDPEKAFGKRRVKSFAAVEPHEVPDLMARLDLEHPDLQSMLACRFLAYTWVRTTEMRMMTWDELVDENTWLLKEGRMKRANDHVVPLSHQAQSIIKVMRERARGSRFVWPGDRSTDRPMSENSVLYLLHRAGYKGRMTGHGWRSTASTWANENGWNPDAIEMQLSHVKFDKVRGVYNRARYLDERRSMMQAWADWLDAQ